MMDRARVELGLWDSDSGRAWQYLARSPPGSAKFGFEPVGLRNSVFKPCVMACLIFEIEPTRVFKKPAGFKDNQARASSGFGFV